MSSRKASLDQTLRMFSSNILTIFHFSDVCLVQVAINAYTSIGLSVIGICRKVRKQSGTLISLRNSFQRTIFNGISYQIKKQSVLDDIAFETFELDLMHFRNARTTRRFCDHPSYPRYNLSFLIHSPLYAGHAGIQSTLITRVQGTLLGRMRPSTAAVLMSKTNSTRISLDYLCASIEHFDRHW